MNRVILLLAIATLCLVAASCTQNATTPQHPGAPEFLRVTDPQCTTLRAPGLPGARTVTIAPSGETSVLVMAAKGGIVTAGRYTVTIPPFALTENTLITVRVEEADGTVGCELLPHGIQFAAPVLLTMNLTGTSFTATEPVTIFWYDTSKGVWVDVGATLDIATLRVSSQLPHFSSYKAGRAGW
jgi:hypothetical protein